MLNDNYDLNIWDKVGHETSYEQEGWSISIYTIPNHGVAYGSGDHLYDIDLSAAEAGQLTLGVGMGDGGDYSPDSDFWMDIQTFFVTYSNIPERVKDELWKLIK
jgi:hypothetical protein